MTITIGFTAIAGACIGGVVSYLVAGQLPFWRLAIVGGAFGIAGGQIAELLVAVL